MKGQEITGLSPDDLKVVIYPGNNEFAIIHIEDEKFQSIIINRCYIYRKCKQYDHGTFGMRGIFDIFNDSNTSSTNCIIQNSKFGFCELTRNDIEGNPTWTEEHWNFERLNRKNF